MKYKVLTNHPVAVDSDDHKIPGGTMHDNSRNPSFNQKLYRLYSGQKLRICDLGCAGGGFVRECLDDGHEAIGIEGSDYSLKWDGPGGTEEERAKRKPGRRAEWAKIPENLFTADVGKPFEVLVEERGIETPDWVWNLAKFDVVTAWELMEHIPEPDLPQLTTNVLKHLAPGGRWIMSVSTQVGDYHVTIKPRSWWLSFFDSMGLVHDQKLVEYFGDDWVRGPKQKAPQSFHLILQRKD